MRNRLAVTTAIIIVGLIVSVLFVDVSAAESGFRAGQFVIWPSGSVAFPTGRFGEEDLDPSSRNIGLKTGYDLAIDVGYTVSGNAIVGLGLSFGRFNFDLTPEILEAYREIGYEIDAGHTSTIQAHAWLRYFLREPFAHWRPYVLIGVGVGRPVATVEYAQPIEVPDLEGLFTETELAVDMSVSMTGGVGALIPVSSGLAFCIEPRYCRISTRGSTRTDTWTRVDGSTAEVKYGKEDGQQFRLKSKSHTEWWEIRAGIVFFLK